MSTDFDFDALLNPQKEKDEEQEEFDFDALLKKPEEQEVPVTAPVVAEEPQSVIEEPTEVPVPVELTPPKPKT